MEQRRFPFTIFVAQINGLNEALAMVLEEGVERRIERHTQAARMCRTGAKGMGLELWPASEEIMSTCVTAISVPDGIDAHELVAHMRERYGIAITGSMKELEGKLIRIGHMGHMAQRVYVEMALSALELSLHDLGYPVQLGQGIVAAQAAN